MISMHLASFAVFFSLFLYWGAPVSAETVETSNSQSKMRFGILTPQHVESLDELMQLWQDAEAWGYDSLWLSDHLLPLRQEGGPAYESWTLLAALAEKTSRARIGVLVTSNTFRHPAVLAKMATTIDHLSSGRLELGIGAGWFQREHQAYGIPFYSPKKLIDRMDEAIQVIRLLWTQTEPTFNGRFYQLNKAPFMPKPVQQPHPPITIGGRGRKWTLPLVARYADKWDIPDLLTPQRLAEEIQYLDKACAEIGRDCSTMEKSHFTCLAFADDPDKVDESVRQIARIFRMPFGEVRPAILVGTNSEEIKRQVNAFAQAGITHLILAVWEQPYDREGLKRFAEEVIPAFR